MIGGNRSGIDHGLRGVAASSRLGQYEATFRDNAIGMDILADLTEDDLSQFGVLFGDRKRLLKAIASLGPVTTVAKLPSAGPAPSSQDTAERRQLTVMFC